MKEWRISFQFHKGAIRTMYRDTDEGAEQIFQFHKGAIRTFARSSFQILRRNFNSIKVRLEPDMPPKGIQASGFQFHKGAIRTMR